MANTITLDSIRSAVEAKYASTDIDLGDGAILTLVSPVRLPKAQREALLAAAEPGEPEYEKDEDGALKLDADLKKIEVPATEEESVERFTGILSAAAKDWDAATGKSRMVDKLIPLLVLSDGSPDLSMLVEIVTGYFEAQQVGEA